MSEACILTGTKQFCVTCDKAVRKATLMLSMGSHEEARAAMYRLCKHAIVHGCEALVSMKALDSYNQITYGRNGPIVEVNTDECSTETEAA